MAQKVDIDQLNIVFEAEDKASAKIEALIKKLGELNSQVSRGFKASGLKPVTKKLKDQKKAADELKDANEKATKSQNKLNEAQESGNKGGKKATENARRQKEEFQKTQRVAETLQETLKFAKAQKNAEVLKKKWEGLVRQLNELRNSGKVDPIRESNLVKQIQKAEADMVSKGVKFEGMTGFEKTVSSLNAFGGIFDGIIQKIGIVKASISKVLGVLSIIVIAVKAVAKVLTTIVKVAVTTVRIAASLGKAMGKVAIEAGKAVVSFAKMGLAIAKVPLTPLIKGFQAVHKRIGAVIGQLARMVKMRIYRLIAKYIVSGFQEGFNNAYHWAKEFENDFASSMDRISTSMQYMKNSLGAMAMPLINVVAPAVDFVVDKFVDFLNVVNQVIAKLTGQSTWTKAVKVPKAYADNMADAAGSARALNEELITILGIDEINPLNADNDSGRGRGSAGGNAVDYSSMFEEQANFEQGASNIAEMIKKAWQNADFTEVGAFVADKLSGVLSNIPWEKVKTAAANIGTSIATFINGALLTKDKFDNTVLDNIAITVAQGLNTAFVGIGAFAKAFKGTEVGESVGTAISTGLNTIDWETIKTSTNTVGTKLAEFINGSLLVKDKQNKTVLQNLGTTLATSINTVFSATGTFFSNLKLGDIGAEIGKGIIDGLNALDWATIQSTLTTIGTKIGNFLNGLFKTDENGDSVLSSLATTVANGINAAIKGAKAFITETKWGDLGTSLANSIKTLISNINWGGENGIGKTFADGVNAAIDFLKNWVANMKDSDLGTKIGTAINDAVDGINWDDLGKVIHDGLRLALDWIKQALDKVDFDKVSEAMRTLFENIDVVDLIKTALTTALEAAGGLGSIMAGIIRGVTMGKAVEKAKEESGKQQQFSEQNQQFADDYVMDEFGNWTQKEYTTKVKIDAEYGPNSKEIIDAVNETGKNKSPKINAIQEKGADVVRDVNATDGTKVSKINSVYASAEARDKILGVNKMAGTKTSTINSVYASQEVKDKVMNVLGMSGTKKSTINSVYASREVKDKVTNVLGMAGTKKSTINSVYASAEVKGKVMNVLGMSGTKKSTINSVYASQSVKNKINNVNGMVGTKTTTIDAWWRNSNAQWRIDYANKVDGVKTVTIDGVYKSNNFKPLTLTGSIKGGGGPNTASLELRKLGGVFSNGKWHSIPQYASGGFPSHGSHFIAGESGVELVGHVGGRTEVLNQSQLASTMYSSVASANASQNRLLQEQNNLLRELINRQGGGGFTVSDVIDGFSQMNRRDGRTVVSVGA